MGFVKHYKAFFEIRRQIRWGAILLATLVCVGCGPQIIKGRPPFVSISGMSMIEDRLSADFDISNENGVPMTITSIDISVRVNEVEITRHDRDFNLTIDANSIEEVHVEKLPDEFTRSLLESLDKREVNNLPFDLNGQVLTSEDGNLRFEHKGYLYPVPGKPGHFRSAVTQAKELRRDDEF